MWFATIKWGVIAIVLCLAETHLAQLGGIGNCDRMDETAPDA
jgi:hypothetical protein